jgi:DNA-binding NtrC family response regulator
MAKRIHANDLVRMLIASPQPIYALDGERTIIFLNPACETWLGAASQGLIGTRLAYHSPPNAASPAGVAGGLCPPPEAFAGKISAAEVVFTPEMGAEKRRRAQFLPLGSPDDLRGILAILDLQDSSTAFAKEEELSLEELTREQLHAAIRRFRWEAAGRSSADHLIGTSIAMQRARRQVETAASSGCSVCISGPAGSGRERLAAAVHYAAHPDEADLPFAQSGLISLDCAVLPAEIILSTLAAVARPHSASSDLEKIAPATLVLHHIDELPAELQAELAALLSKKPFPRRLISTTTDPLDELVQRGKFRADLAALLMTIGIELSPLKDRREDLPLLAQIFLEDCNRQGPKQIGGFAPAALDKLDAYTWPGNLDELAVVVAAAHKNAQGTEIQPAELPPQIHLAAQAAAHPRRAEETIRLDEFLERVERELIRRALGRAKGNKTKAARLLGLTRPRLYRRMVQLGLEEA